MVPVPVSVASSLDVAWTRIVPVPCSRAVPAVATRACRSRVPSPVTATDSGAPPWIITVFAPASSTLVNDATSRRSATETPEPRVNAADVASGGPAVAITTITAATSTPTTASGQALDPGADHRRTPRLVGQRHRRTFRQQFQGPPARPSRLRPNDPHRTGPLGACRSAHTVDLD